LSADQELNEPVSPEAKWEANRAKVAFAMAFPGLLTVWKDAEGKTVDAVVPASDTTIVLFTDGSFGLIPVRERDPASVVAALGAARPRLEPLHPDAYATLDRLDAKDREMARRARLEKILGAIRHNAADIPELKDAVRRLAASWTDHPSPHGQTDQTPGR
jgi:hypothetical protein